MSKIISLSGATGANKKRMLFIGDIAAPTGFSTVNEAVLTRLDRDYWQMPHVLAINHNGDPHPLNDTMRLYPAQGAPDCDAYGVARFAGLLQAVKPDVIFTQQDAWVIAMYIQAAKLENLPLPPLVAWIPPDAENQSAGVRLNGGVSHLVCPSQFGLDALRTGGYEGPASVVRYAADKKLFVPIDRMQARKAMGLPDQVGNAFLFGRADRNAVRKRYDITVAAFGQWWNEYDKPDAYLFLHCSPRDIGWDLIQLAKYYGLGTDDWPRVIFTSHELKPTAIGMAPRKHLPIIFNMWNAHLSTAMGEGGGLIALESAACGIPQILPRHSALAEWFGPDAAEWIEPSADFVHTGGINTVGKVVSVADTVQAMENVFRSPARCTSLGEKAFDRAKEFDWDETTKQIEGILRKAIDDGR